MDYVYMLRCGDGSFYTGWTNHLCRRLRAHASGQGAKYTKAHQPVQLVHAEVCEDKRAALRREYAIKQLTRRQKQQLIRGNGERKMGKIFYLMGKSASGKDTIYQKLINMQELGLQPLIIYTTRPMRDGEVEGIAYHFTDETGLGRLREEGKVIEERAYRVVSGVWHYFTVDDGSFDTGDNILGIGTLESFICLRSHFGEKRVIPLYIDVEDKVRIHRAITREDKQEQPQYEEMCRRFLADQEDFSPEKLSQAGIEKKFANNEALSSCTDELADYVLVCLNS